jgi:hypothetical protein
MSKEAFDSKMLYVLGFETRKNSLLELSDFTTEDDKAELGYWIAILTGTKDMLPKQPELLLILALKIWKSIKFMLLISFTILPPEKLWRK